MKQSLIFKRLKLPCIAFAAVGALYLLYFALFGFYPFGERSVAWCDMEQQYVPLLMELRGIVMSGGSALLGRGGGGMNLWGVILFFVSSPLGVLSLFVSAEKMIYFVNILTVLKLSLCGASASFYFRRLFSKLPGSFNVLLSVMYSFSGYVMMYYQNSMWLDMMILFPLLLLSLFRLCRSGRWGAYTVMLSLAMLMNFYISYMIVLFIVIAFGAMLIFCCKRNRRGECAVKFFAADLCAALMTAAVWLPSLKQFSVSGRGESSVSLFIKGTFFEDSADKLAMLSCTSAVLAAIAVMIFRRRLFRSGKAAFFGVMTLIVTVGAFIGPANKIWHTGSYQAFPLRYGFIILLLGLSVCAVLLTERVSKSCPDRRTNAFMLAALGIFIIALMPGLANSDKLTSYMDSLWVKGNDAAVIIAYGVLGAVVYTVFIMSYRRGRISRRFAAALMGGAMLCETLFSFSVYMGNTSDVTARFNQTMELCGKIDDGGFYRVKSMRRYFYSNMPEAMGFNSIGHYTSLTDRDFLFSSKRLGYSSYWLDMSSNGGTLITDAFLMNKYLVGVNGDMNALYEPYNTEDVLKIYRNSVVSGGAAVSPYSPAELADYDGTERMESSAYMAEKLYGAGDIIQSIEPYACENLEYTEENGTKSVKITDVSEEAYFSYSFFAEGKQELYFDLFSNYSTSLTEPYFGAASIYVNEKLVEGDYPSKRFSGIIDLGSYEDKYVSVKIVVHKDFEVSSFGLFALDADKAAERIASVNTGKITLDGNKIRITAESPEGGYIYIPFAYGEGFRAKLNGRSTEIYRVFGSFMAVKLENGANELTLTFCPEGLIPGAMISVVGAAVFVLLMLCRRRARISGRAGRFAYRAALALSAAAIVFIYIISSAAWLIMRLIGG